MLFRLIEIVAVVFSMFWASEVIAGDGAGAAAARDPAGVKRVPSYSTQALKNPISITPGWATDQNLSQAANRSSKGALSETVFRLDVTSAYIREYRDRQDWQMLYR